MVESLTVKTKQNPTPKYDFCKEFYKFPSYLRRTAISEAIGKVSSYFGNLKNWEKGNPSKRGKRPGLPHSEYIYQAMYRKNIFIRTDTYKASIKVFIRNTWDWLDVEFRKSDVDYIQPHCHSYKKCVPTLQKRGKEWFLDFVYQTNSLFRLPFLKISSAEIEGNNIKISGKATIENSKI